MCFLLNNDYVLSFKVCACDQKFEKSTMSTYLVSLSDNLGFGTGGCYPYSTLRSTKIQLTQLQLS